MSAKSFLSSVEHVKATLVGQKLEKPPFMRGVGGLGGYNVCTCE
jgi:hypothetical protein